VDKVDHLNPVLLSTQLAAILRRAIESGELAPRQALPSESGLMREHGVSRVTVRAALASLRQDGLIVSVKARGTYVADAGSPAT
jgi:GntR family transcriptional regulator